MTYDNRQFYIDGAWVDPAEAKEFKVVNPATEEVAGIISLGGPKDVERAVAAARRAFDSYSRTSPAERLALLERVLGAYNAHYDEIAEGDLHHRDGCAHLARQGLARHPRGGSHQRHGRGLEDLQVRGAARNYAAGPRARRRVRAHHTLELAHESGGGKGRSGACGRLHHGLEALRILAVQRNPLGQGLARGWRSGRRGGQLDQRRRPGRVGAPLPIAPEIDMVSFYRFDARGNGSGEERGCHGQARTPGVTGGTAQRVARRRRPRARRVKRSVLHVYQNSGQRPATHRRACWCLPPSSPRSRRSRGASRPKVAVGDPRPEKTTPDRWFPGFSTTGSSATSAKGIAEGALPRRGALDGLRGFPKVTTSSRTIFSGVRNDMTIAREEIFQSKACDPAVRDRGAGVCRSRTIRLTDSRPMCGRRSHRACAAVGCRTRAGQVTLNGAAGDMQTPPGGFKMSGNGRE